MRWIDADRLLAKLSSRKTYLMAELDNKLIIPQYEENRYVVDVVEKMAQEHIDSVTHGRWVDIELQGPFCSNCGRDCFWKYDYCPFCGAKMDEVPV